MSERPRADVTRINDRLQSILTAVQRIQNEVEDSKGILTDSRSFALYQALMAADTELWLVL